jgi:hypothetical protein
MTFDTLKNSAIARTELFMQRRAQTKRRNWRHPALYGSMVLLGAFSIGTGLAALYIGFIDDRWIRMVLALFYLLLTLWHFGLMLRTLFLSSMAVTREKRDTERWEALLLTGVSGREIVQGKWWATVRTQWIEYLFLAVIRAAAAVSIGSIGQGLVPIYPSYVSYRGMDTTIPNIIIGIVIIMVLTLANLPFTAACGVMSAMDTKRGGGLVRGFGARAAFTMLAALLPLLLWLFIGGWGLWQRGFMSYNQYNSISSFIGQFTSILVDNGMSLSGNIIANIYWIQNRQFEAFLIVGLALAAYGGLTWALLRVAQWRAERTGALRTRETKGTAE